MRALCGLLPALLLRKDTNPAENMLLNKVNEADIGHMEAVSAGLRSVFKPRRANWGIPQNQPTFAR
jgi:hypothetical protein